MDYDGRITLSSDIACAVLHRTLVFGGNHIPMVNAQKFKGVTVHTNDGFLKVTSQDLFDCDMSVDMYLKAVVVKPAPEGGE